MQLTDKIEQISKTLKTQNYFFNWTSDHEIILYLEGKAGTSFKFRGLTMQQCVQDAENYINENYKIDSKQAKLF
jgi:hypothetical protein